MGKDVWYKKGVRFSCTQCGRCCTGPEGFVWVNNNEIKKIAQYLNISIEELKEKHTHLVEREENPKSSSLKKHKKKRSLTEIPSEKNPGDFDCTFLAEDGACSIYPHRPKQCRTYPFWPEILKSRRSWEDEARYCEGINHEEAKVVAFASIQENLTEQIQYERTHKPSEES